MVSCFGKSHDFPSNIIMCIILLCCCRFISKITKLIIECLVLSKTWSSNSYCLCFTCSAFKKIMRSPIPTLRYYLIPCFFFFDRSHKLLDLVLKMMGSLITDSSSSLFSLKYATDCSSRINAIVSVLVLMHKDVKVQQIISSLKAEIDRILRKILSFQVQFFCISRMSLRMS
jgi:hypothetical protein